jgi:hypothetical protein
MTRRRPLALDSLNWWPLTEVHAWLTRRLGNRHFAASDLTEELKADRVRCLARQMPPFEPSKKLWPAKFWNTYELTSWPDGLQITPRRDSELSPTKKVGRSIQRLIVPMKGVTLYGWGPDLKKTWPGLEESFAPFAKPPVVATKPAESLKEPGHPEEYVWAEIDRRARAIKRRIPAITRSQLIEKIQGELEEQGEKVPGTSTFYAHFKKNPY